ncbi:hypothetical protein POPTR_019G108700v4 [Populus trichocarpa]|uniref:Uncharacterized protein n=1 Tax=Populus trichocarpa TaxID=3694 RepID=A9P9T3_POPTR|nr:uncharacterized protein LOC18108604 [Populus trichocarpa]ABK93136.1 unknown [Populus trichocarpa]ABK93955.1 unknown [Populus trichocarpa]PNS91494.1 hypothetical protein POPTR_019G108700v4 [Populus trichocarpa]|eukprot:XP_006371610.2 uncharacterized protein LOC18108604 isoform X2 [Populus trichocarpa]
MEPPRTTSTDSRPNSFTKFRVSSSSSTTSRPSPPRSRQPSNDSEPSLNIDGEPISNLSITNRPGGSVLQPTSSSLVSSKPAREILRAEEERTVAASTKIQRQSMITEAKPDFEAQLERLKKLSEMEAESNVVVEIAYIVNSLKASSSSKSIPEEIIKKCQEGEMSLRQGLMLAKKAQELLRSALDEGLFSA